MTTIEDEMRFAQSVQAREEELRRISDEIVSKKLPKIPTPFSNVTNKISTGCSTEW